MSMHEFSDRPFIAGSLTGQRAWCIDKLGRLTGVHYKSIWTPGENDAACQRNESSNAIGGNYWYPMPSISTMHFSWFDPKDQTFNVSTSPPPAHIPLGAISAPEPTPSPPVSLKKKAKHQTAQLACECGFYAYFDNEGNPYYARQSGHIQGIVEAYGLVTVGSRGFRASKAKIKALVIPRRDTDDKLYQRVRANYPDVAFFEKKRDALAAFPLTEPDDLPTPETDAEFWTRKVS